MGLKTSGKHHLRNAWIVTFAFTDCAEINRKYTLNHTNGDYVLPVKTLRAIDT